MTDRGPGTLEDELTVLFVDDYPEYAKAGVEYLERTDDAMEVLSETCAEAALERLSMDAVDCVVCDYEMPTMNGAELLESVREDHPALPFIILSGHEPDRLAPSVEASAAVVLQKGSGTHTFEQLRSQIRELTPAETGFCFDNVTG
ncbi:response regulator [Natronomonas salina]|uniref:response regulator n=1 Tax=Natronomonas salina TaxID=1710540 RepID=UPI0015B436C5|nr:response regulator [Natronomonas salina]QLD90294.1 response regulator [Natronomonas salina]